MRIDIVIATTGRPAILKEVVARLGLQSRPADGVIVVGACAEDVSGLEGTLPNLELIITEKGLCRQRNAALKALAGHSDIVVFFDDDFIPAHDFLSALERLMQENPHVVGLTGCPIADGAHSSPISMEHAVTMLDIKGERPKPETKTCSSLYGCNMAFRLSAADGLWFDENLPLYGWQEDVDFTHQLSWRGTLLKTSELTGVHLGARSGKTSGKKLGYSQVANIVYLWRKGTMQPWIGGQQLFRNIVSNIVRSLWEEPDIDRRGRLAGNFLAFGDLLKGSIDPRRIESL